MHPIDKYMCGRHRKHSGHRKDPVDLYMCSRHRKHPIDLYMCGGHCMHPIDTYVCGRHRKHSRHRKDPVDPYVCSGHCKHLIDPYVWGGHRRPRHVHWPSAVKAGNSSSLLSGTWGEQYMIYFQTRQKNAQNELEYAENGLCKRSIVRAASQLL